VHFSAFRITPFVSSFQNNYSIIEMATEKKDLAPLNAEDLHNELEALEAGYQKTKFEHAIKGLANPNELRETRKNIARVLTEIRSREVAAMSPEELAGRSKKRARRSK
jgi:large subunit ribosomal protein L29